MGVCNCSMFFCTLLYVLSSTAIILMGKRELVVLLNSSSWCLVIVERLFLAVLWCCLWFVIVVFPDHAHLLFFLINFVYFCHVTSQIFNISTFYIATIFLCFNNTLLKYSTFIQYIRSQRFHLLANIESLHVLPLRHLNYAKNALHIFCTLANIIGKPNPKEFS